MVPDSEAPDVNFINMLLSRKIPKAQKDSQVISVFLHFWDLGTKKAIRKMLVKLTPVALFPDEASAWRLNLKRKSIKNMKKI